VTQWCARQAHPTKTTNRHSAGIRGGTHDPTRQLVRDQTSPALSCLRGNEQDVAVAHAAPAADELHDLASRHSQVFPSQLSADKPHYVKLVIRVAMRIGLLVILSRPEVTCAVSQANSLGAWLGSPRLSASNPVRFVAFSRSVVRRFSVTSRMRWWHHPAPRPRTVLAELSIGGVENPASSVSRHG
jgi:hypothetical protein